MPPNMYLSAINLIPFIPITSYVPLNNVTIQNQHIPGKATKQRGKINKLQSDSYVGRQTQINRQADKHRGLRYNTIR